MEFLEILVSIEKPIVFYNAGYLKPVFNQIIG